MYAKYRLEIVVVVISCSYNSVRVYVCLLKERKKKTRLICVLEIVCILRSCVFNSIKGVKTCVRLPGGNRIIRHMSVCQALK